MAVSGLLQRLRPAGAPGAAGPVAVPAQPEDGALAELAPVFDALAPVIIECDAIRTAAGQAAAEKAADARRDAAAVVADATSRAPAERAVAAAAVQRSGDEVADKLVANAQAAAAQLKIDGAQRLDDLTELVIRNLRARIATGAGPAQVDR